MSVGRVGAMEAGAFWVWHRGSELSAAEWDALEAARVKRVCWQVAEGEWRDGGWRFVKIAGPMQGVGEIEWVPVIRLKPEAGFLGRPGAAAELARWIREWRGGAAMGGEVQVDFDCPSRLLGEYAGFLKRLGEELSPVKVSATALASWVRAPGFEALAGSVCELVPMFYDLQGDSLEAAARGEFLPMAGGAVDWRVVALPGAVAGGIAEF